MRNIGITALFAAVVFGMPMLPLLAQNSTQPHTPDQPPSTHQMMMGGMMDDCQKHCDTMKATMADISKTIAAARTSNDVSNLHAALDRAQAGITKMEAQMQECRGAMEKMMQGRGRMNQPAPDGRR